MSMTQPEKDKQKRLMICRLESVILGFIFEGDSFCYVFINSGNIVLTFVAQILPFNLKLSLWNKMY